MEPIKINERVGLILKTNVQKKICYFLGYGIYLGFDVPDKGIKHKVWRKLARLGKQCCKFQLDNSEIIYDFQCWFMSEERFNEVFINDYYKEGWKVVNVSSNGRRRK